ncbi:hypothetical protein JAAARDRAFT_29500 [Jaapia argillacea MUCL 33604]|uniref:Cas1p 10 TM acyl transferase domain-containing protein n=1 Tax=Jaapia argillacea MUCL 33604 TaxID=933084 RepID=A0A067QBG8_9AGAM|nr:hypothetical protein JAAARDRAFT_29500 [Jaapia argillacea MUCL 33604]
MPPSKRLAFSLNPLWAHYVSLGCVLLGIVVGLVRYSLLDHFDPLHCGALLSEGSWLDQNFKNWQPEGCMLHSYQPKDVSACLSNQQEVVFVGDSVTRKLFFQMANLVDSKLPTTPPDDDHKHSDYRLHSSSGIQLSFYWDPFLNATQTYNRLNSYNGRGSTTQRPPHGRPALLVLGSGLWYLRYADSSGGLPAWEITVENILETIARGRFKPADEVVLLPIEEVVMSKLSQPRATTMRLSDIDAMNSDLFHRINPPSGSALNLFYPREPSMPISFPLVFNRMLDASQTDDGLHFSDSLVRLQANVLLNLRCNDVLPKKFPMDKTCCRSYPWPSPLHFIVVAAVVLWGPYALALTWQQGSKSFGASLLSSEQMPAVIISASLGLIYLADRTGFWLKEQKQFDPWAFASLSIASLGVGLATVKRSDKDLGFLNREQTDEWKGWMQIAILIYHYFGASKISGIYNPIRALVAAYLFMTGYGHTTFYVKKADFGFLRVAQVMIRLNLFTVFLAYVMNTDYLSYYFTPLVSMWFLIIWVTMYIGSQYNDRTVFLVCKILVSMGLVTWFMSEPWLLEGLFEFLERFCNIQWSAREWGFRVNLDLWIVYVGMFAALAVIKAREHRLMDHPQWAFGVKVATMLSGVIMVWFFAFELMQPSKFVYNAWQPYISFLPILAFVVLRNANPVLRSASSRAFAFIGTCSLETFIIQFHLWLAADTKGVLLIIPGTRWRPVNMILTTIVFIYVSHRVAQATGDITAWICGTTKKSLPTIADPPPTSAGRSSGSAVETIPLTSSSDGHVRKDNDDNVLPPEPETPIRPVRRWADRLAEGSSPPSTRGFRLWYGEKEWTPGVKAKVAIGLGVMWFLNVIWPS